ncbi:hypothetical protein [Embleya sp. NPDC001921]
MSTSPPWLPGDVAWRKLGPRDHHFGTITRVWQDAGRWMVEYEHGVRPSDRALVTAPADEMYADRPCTRPV